MIVYLLFVRGTFYKAFKDANKAYEWSQTHLDEEDKQDAWIVPEDVE